MLVRVELGLCYLGMAPRCASQISNSWICYSVFSLAVAC